MSADLELAARASLLHLSDKLTRLDGELEGEARQVHLLSVMPLRSADDLYRAVDRLVSVRRFVEDWTANFKPRTTREDAKVGQLQAVLALCDSGELAPADADTARLLTAARILLDDAVQKKEDADERYLRECVEPAQDAARAACDALCALVDARVPHPNLNPDDLHL